MLVIRSQIGPTCATKYTEHGIIRWSFEEAFYRAQIINDSSGQSIDEISGCEEGLVPKFNRYGGMNQESKASFNYMTMLAFGRSILLVSMWVGNTMSYAKGSKKLSMKFLYSPPQSDWTHLILVSRRRSTCA